MKLKKKTLSLLYSAICLLCAMLLFSCAGTSGAQMEAEKPMQVTLKILSLKTTSPVSVKLGFTLKNNTNNRYQLLTWGTPLEGALNENIFDVTHNGAPLPYEGPQFKRGTPQQGDFVVLNPQSELTAVITLEEGYFLNRPGLYTVWYRKPYVTVKNDWGAEQLIPVRSNRVTFSLGS